jgi:hypothetical protein
VTLRDLESARAEREERATLWPVDELPASNDGAVTIGHMRDTMALARRVANANVSVLITGGIDRYEHPKSLEFRSGRVIGTLTLRGRTACLRPERLAA